MNSMVMIMISMRMDAGGGPSGEAGLTADQCHLSSFSVIPITIHNFTNYDHFVLFLHVCLMLGVRFKGRYLDLKLFNCACVFCLSSF